MTPNPPRVRLRKPLKALEPGSKVTLRWNAWGNQGSVTQKIRFYPMADNGAFQEVATLSPD